MSEELVNFFKAFADTNRLKIVGLLADKPYSVEELASLLNLKPSTVSHHLARLTKAGPGQYAHGKLLQHVRSRSENA